MRQKDSLRRIKEGILNETGHLSEEYYESFLKRFYAKNYVYTLKSRYRSFKRLYPLISDWFNEDLEVRVGGILNQKGTTFKHRINSASRLYIQDLVIIGMKLDYDYLFSTFRNYTRFKKVHDCGADDLRMVFRTLKYAQSTSANGFLLDYSFYRILMHAGKRHYSEFTLDDLSEFSESIESFIERGLQYKFWPMKSKKNDFRTRYKTSLHRLHLALFSLGIVQKPTNRKSKFRPIIFDKLNGIKNANVRDIVKKFIEQRSLVYEKSTVDLNFFHINRFAIWLEEKHPDITDFSMLTRAVIEEYFLHLNDYISPYTGRPYGIVSKVMAISHLKVFLDAISSWDSPYVPKQLLITYHDIPKQPKRLPRPIPEKDLDKLMDGVRKLECPYRRNALILIRWTGARKGEILRLDKNALFCHYDGTPMLRLPVGKNKIDRCVPIHPEAKKAYQELVELRKSACNTTGLPDEKTGQIVDYLFMRRNTRLSPSYVFEKGLTEACKIAGLLTDGGRTKYSTHQFRHTVGSMLANRGATLPIIMKMLGHQSPQMSLGYIDLHDATLKSAYQKAVGPHAVVAGGEYAETIKWRRLSHQEVDWIKTNFHKTYLIMGHCFHHTKEPMCDFADACYFCAKFVTTKDHLPVLTEKYATELKLVEDAKRRKWSKEVTRHLKVADRVKKIIDELGGTVNA